MEAKDVMTSNIITVSADTSVSDIATALVGNNISAVPVVNENQEVIGIVSEGDLMRREESDTEARHSWWLRLFLGDLDEATNYIKTHGRHADDVMTRNVVTVEEHTPLHEIARLLERHHIKRVPVVRDNRIVGIVSRANLLHGLAAQNVSTSDESLLDDRDIRERIEDVLTKKIQANMSWLNVTVRDGNVQLWGYIENLAEKKAAQLAAENTAGVKSVENNLAHLPPWVWAE